MTGEIDLDAALDRAKLLIRTLTEQLGPDHPDTFAARHDLVRLMFEHSVRDGFHDARTRMQRLARDRQRVLGPSHEDTLATLRELVGIQRSMGYFEGARQTELELQRSLGPDQPEARAIARRIAAEEAAHFRWDVHRWYTEVVGGSATAT